MKKIFKKNQIIITALAVMIAAAGYISYSDAQIKGKKDKTAKTETASETETSVNMDQVLQDMENLDLDVTDETGAATASDGTDATASGEESSGTESQTQETPGEAVLTGASTYMAQARIEREQIRSQNKCDRQYGKYDRSCGERSGGRTASRSKRISGCGCKSDRRDSGHCSTGYPGGRCQQSAD